MGHLLELSNIETYYGPVNAIKGVSIIIGENEIRTVLGANGAGKTTILRTISGVIRPEKGVIRFKDERIDGLRPDKIVNLGISHVPEGREIFPQLSTLENLKMGAFVRKDRSKLNEDFNMVFSYFPLLKNRVRQRAGTLSGGEQQMLAIGRGILSKPKLLLLDEPSLGIAPILLKEIFKQIRLINREEGTAILLVEQNAILALNIGSYGYILETGRVVLDDTTSHLLENEDVKEFYLGVAKKSPKGYKRWKRKKKWR